MASRKKDPPAGVKVDALPPMLADPSTLAYGPPRDPLSAPADPKIILRDLPITSYTGRWAKAGVDAALDAHKNGQFSTAAMLADDLYGDDRVQATLGSRTGALFGQRAIHTRGKADTDGACFDAWREQYACMSADGVFNEIKRQAIVMGFSVSEILYDTSVTPWRQYLKPWSARYIYYRWDIRRLVAMTTQGPVIIEPGDGKWFVHAPYGLYRGWVHATIRAIADLWLIKKLAWRDWARFNERHGLPIIKAMVPAAGDAKQKDNFINGLSTMGQEACVMLPQNVDETGYDIELLEARDRAYDTFGKTIEAVDRSIILAIKSQNLTTEVTEGSFAAARQHGGTEQVTLEFDERTFSYDLYEQVSRPFALFNYGDPDAATDTHWDVEPIEDRAATAKTSLDASAALVQLKEKGIPVDVAAFCAMFKIPLDPKAEPPSKVGQIFAYHIQQGGIVTVNEIRDSLGLEPIPGGDVPTEAPAKGGSGEAFAASHAYASEIAASAGNAIATALAGVQMLKGRDGVDGAPGAAGLPGRDGVDGRPGVQGVAGIDGKNGRDGKDGKKSERLSFAERNAAYLADVREMQDQGLRIDRATLQRLADGHGVPALDMATE